MTNYPRYNKTASFDIDCQKTFTPLCPQELPVPKGHEIVESLNLQAKLAKWRVGSKDAHSPEAEWLASPDNPQFTPIGHYPAGMDCRWNSHGIVGSKGFELLDGLPHPTQYDFFVWKGIETNLHPYGACYHDLDERLTTGIIEWLYGMGVRYVIIGGLAFDYCVKTTAIQLSKAGFIVQVNLRATRALSSQTASEAWDEMIKNGVAIYSDLYEIKRIAELGEPNV